MTDPTTPEQTPEQLASDFKKEELKAAAAVQGVDVPATATKADIAAALVSQTPAAVAERPVVAVPSDGNPGMPHLTSDQPAVQFVTPDGRNRRTDDDAKVGGFVDVVDGEHKGRFGAFERILEHGKDGWPSKALVRTRDEFNELLVVPYEHLRDSVSKGGR
jgi:hypothetical protein